MILDIVETGTTLRENNLCVFEEVVDISARLISNKSAFKFKNAMIEKVVQNIMREISSEDKDDKNT